ncbi:MAG: hypothetical protein K6G22_01465 [Lachnospiraceae bacterium]|nr:hypothetical protein [Lachnospiraceae bacterium]
MNKRVLLILMSCLILAAMISGCGKDKKDTSKANDKVTAAEDEPKEQASEPAPAADTAALPAEPASDTTAPAAEAAVVKEDTFEDEIGNVLSDDISVLGFGSIGDTGDHLWIRCGDGCFRLIDADRTVLKVINGKWLEDHNDGYMFYSDDLAEYAYGIYDLEGNEITKDHISGDEKPIDILHYKGNNYLVTLEEKETISDYMTIFRVYDDSMQPVITVDSSSVIQQITPGSHWYDGITMDIDDQVEIEVMVEEGFEIPKMDRYGIKQIEGSELFLIHKNERYALLLDLKRDQYLLLDAPMFYAMFDQARIVGDEVLWGDGYRFRYNLASGQYDYADDDLARYLTRIYGDREVEQGEYFRETAIQGENQFMVVKNDNGTCFTAYCDLSGKFLCEPVKGDIIMTSNGSYTGHDGLNAYSPKTCLIAADDGNDRIWYAMNSKGETEKLTETRSDGLIDFYVCKKDGHVTYFTIDDYKLLYATIETEE